MAKSKVERKKVIKAAVFGSLAGAVTGLLLAPKSGQELRHDLADQAHKLGEKAVVIKDKAQSALQNVEEKTQITLNTGKNWLQKKKQFVDNFKTLISEIQNGALTKTSLKIEEHEDPTENLIEDITEEPKDELTVEV
ncbi:gas vesicle protein [Desulfosporosinus sp. HMP52]|uniref:YtxH domain-containing protein n=1 Tax=Desulfosporosinus sp. HMP52 TaxID=1487923 RepID=UPI00051FB53B|nr:YtxH domain-containing protein [Desulfosporosinus sp. HMP52]KGK88997.1 gas vesicle protein [Desulfosporosinus sp. HMP52]